MDNDGEHQDFSYDFVQRAVKYLRLGGIPVEANFAAEEQGDECHCTEEVEDGHAGAVEHAEIESIQLHGVDSFELEGQIVQEELQLSLSFPKAFGQELLPLDEPKSQDQQQPGSHNQ